MEKRTSFTNSSPPNAKKFFCHTQTMKIKVIDLFSSKTKLYSTFFVDSMTSNLVVISDRHKIKSAPLERISLQTPHVTVVPIRKFYSLFVILWLHLLTISKYSFLVFLPIVDIVKSDASNRIFRTL